MRLSKNYILRCIIVFLCAFLFINCMIVYHFFLITDNDDGSQRYEEKQQLIWTEKMKLFCSKVQQRLEDEKRNKELNTLIQQNVKITPPNFKKNTEQQSKTIPYHYSDWLSSPDLPRRLTPCEHQIYTELLRILDHFFRRHSIFYMITDGTLLGSYTHHDFLPWDDDVDLRASRHDRSRIYTLLYEEFENVIGISHINDAFGSYDKLYFLWTPKAGIKEWSYPSVDLAYFDENSTHVWRVNNDIDLINDCSIAKKNIFPLVWRPFGEIWLAAPREPLIIFELHRWTEMTTSYYATNYSHKYERQISSIDAHAKPDQLHPYYPRVKRYCLKTYCVELLVTIFKNTSITLHTTQFEKYRMELFYNPKIKNRICIL